MAKPKSPLGDFQDPVYNIASIFTARRDLRPVTKVLAERAGLTVEEADVLVLLYGLRKLGWDDCPVSEDGYVTFGDLKSITVHDGSLLGRRVRKLQHDGLVHVRSSRVADPDAHAKSQQVRIEDKGIAKVKPIWEVYSKFSKVLLKEFSEKELAAHRRVNERISEILRERRNPARHLFGFVS